MGFQGLRRFGWSDSRRGVGIGRHVVRDYFIAAAGGERDRESGRGGEWNQQLVSRYVFHGLVVMW